MQLNKILQKLAAARLITLSGDKYELTHDTLAKLIAGKRSVEEQAVIDWENLLRNKLLGVKQSGTSDYLTVAQLEGLKPYLHKLQLNAEEQQFLQESQVFRAKEAEDERRRLVMLILFFVGLSLMVLVTLFWAVYQGRIVQRELNRNEKIVAGMYFYMNRFALCVKKDSSGHFKYGFMDKEGNVRVPYEYDEAVQFDEYGYARVKIKGALYLIDTLNNRYPLAESLAALDNNTLALSLKEQHLDTFPAVILEHSQLKILYLRGNFFANTTQGLEKLTNLEVLDLGYNKLAILPESMGGLKQLKILDLQNNILTKIDSAVLELSSLEMLNLSGNQIGTVPSAISALKNLKILNLSNNILTKFDIGLLELSSLEMLNLSGNKIGIIPPEIKQLKELKTLNLSNNELEKIDKALADLPKLKELNLNHNHINSIPKELTQKTELVIHSSGHKMKKQSLSNSYKGNNEEEDENNSNTNKSGERSNSNGIEIGNVQTAENQQNGSSKSEHHFKYYVVKIAGDNQSASAHDKLDKPIKVLVMNVYSQVLAGVKVHFEVSSGGGSISENEVITDKDGFAQVNWVVGADGKQVLTVMVKDDSLGGKASMPQTFNAISHYIVDERDGETYAIVTIGNQIWMAENLRFKAKGSRINPKNPTIRYGRLYEWDALMGNYNMNSAVNQGLCPKGWHVPTKAEWDELRNGRRPVTLKSSYYWDNQDPSDVGLLNLSGFSGLPAGKYNRLTNSFSDLGSKAYFASATEVTAMYAIFYELSGGFAEKEDLDKDNGFSCRCIKD